MEKVVAATQVHFEIVMFEHKVKVVLMRIYSESHFLQPKISFRKRKNQSFRERDDDD